MRMSLKENGLYLQLPTITLLYCKGAVLSFAQQENLIDLYRSYCLYCYCNVTDTVDLHYTNAELLMLNRNYDFTD